MDKGAEYYARYLSGDDQGLVMLVRDYKDGLIMYINRICGNYHTAEDICEDTFFKLVAKRPGYDGKASFKTWLYSIARNTAYDELRRRRVDVSTDELDIGYGMDLEEEYAAKETRAQVRAAVEKLPTDQREAVWLTYFEDMSVGETARIMKRSKNAVSLLLKRAKANLKTDLKKRGSEYEELL